MENLLLPPLLQCPWSHCRMAAQVLPSLPCSFAGGIAIVALNLMRPVLEPSHGLTKWLLAKTWLTDSYSSSEDWRCLQSPTPLLAVRVDRQMVAILWSCVPRGQRWASPCWNGQDLMAGVDDGICHGAGCSSGGRSNAFQLKVVRQRYFKYIGLKKMLVSSAGADWQLIYFFNLKP